MKFSTFFALNIAKNVFCVCEQVATTLQSPSISAQTVLSSVKALTDNLQQQRDNFPLTYDSIEKASHSLCVGAPQLPRKTQVPRRLQHINAEEFSAATPREHYRKEFYEVIDACMGEVKRRFSQKSFDILVDIHVEKALINCSNGDVTGPSYVTE